MLEMLSSVAVSGGRSVAQTAETETMAPAAIQSTGELGFDAVIKQVATDAIGTLKAGEAASISAVEGKESTRRVVEALMSAEQALQTAVAVRDKVVQAYQEIVRMSI
jgi:flagellar hook-basal body complex protein FliE